MGIERSHGLDDAALPRVSDLLQLDRGSLSVRGPGRRAFSGRHLLGARSGRSRLMSGGRCSIFEQLHPVCERLAREIRVLPRHLDDGQLEREPRIATLANVVESDGEQVNQP